MVTSRRLPVWIWVVSIALLWCASPLAAEQEKSWSFPKLGFWKGKGETRVAAKKKEKSRASRSAAREGSSPFSWKAPEIPDAVVHGPARMARRIGDGTTSVLKKTRDVVTSPWQSDTPRSSASAKASRSASSRTAKKKSVSWNPFARKPPENPASVEEFLSQPKPGF